MSMIVVEFTIIRKGQNVVQKFKYLIKKLEIKLRQVMLGKIKLGN